MRRGKKYKQAKETLERGKAYDLEEAIRELKECAYAKFDETVEMSLRLGVDPKHADQMVRGTALLPNGTGKKITVLVLTKGEKETEAKEAGGETGKDPGHQEDDAQPQIRHGDLRRGQGGEGIEGGKDRIQGGQGWKHRGLHRKALLYP